MAYVNDLGFARNCPLCVVRWTRSPRCGRTARSDNYQSSPTMGRNSRAVAVAERASWGSSGQKGVVRNRIVEPNYRFHKVCDSVNVEAPSRLGIVTTQGGD